MTTISVLFYIVADCLMVSVNRLVSAGDPM